MNLLNTNTKLLKTIANWQYLVAGLTIAPHNIGGHNVCEASTAACRAACVLWWTGRTVTKPVRDAMIRRKTLLFSNPKEFERLLRQDLERLIAKAEKAALKPACRLNVASDLDWRHIIEDYPQISFYDYTKVKRRLKHNLPNYQVTYSYHERSPWQTTRAQLERGSNVAAIFSTRYHPQSGTIGKLPDSWTIANREYPVIDGDSHDVRLSALDGSGVIVGLRFKGSLKRRLRAINAGFCLNV